MLYWLSGVAGLGAALHQMGIINIAVKTHACERCVSNYDGFKETMQCTAQGASNEAGHGLS